MAHHRNFDIETTIVPDVAGQYEAAFVIREQGRDKNGDNPDRNSGQKQGDAPEREDASTRGRRYKFPPVGSYLTPDDAREQTEAWARKWIDENFPE